MIFSQPNPFQELYVTDSVLPEDFVRYFSPFLIPHMLPLFREGNVVLKGTQGCGKSMLLKLFQPEIRVAYAKCNEKGQKVAFPIPEALQNFLGAGVNLSKSGILDIAQMLPPEAEHKDFIQLTGLFTDLLNYWLLRDLLQTIAYMQTHSQVFGDLVQFDRLDAFVNLLAKQDCWFGYLSECQTFGELAQRVNERVIAYRGWFALNSENLPQEILTTKTAIGEPLAGTVECLKLASVLEKNIPVFLRIDQVEELWHKDGAKAQLGRYFRQVINRILGTRDLRVSFRVGTRRYSWDGFRDDLSMPGGRKIEELRDFVTIDLDKELRRSENRSGWLFEGFAADVFKHRIAQSSKLEGQKGHGKKLLREFFGPSPTPQQLVQKLIVKPPDDPQKLLKLDDKWSEDWKKAIFSVYNSPPATRSKMEVNDAGEMYPKDPLGALLLVAWGQQTGGKSTPVQRRRAAAPTAFPPWSEWWRKERLMIALMQLTVRHQQYLFWWGTEKVLALSASNITLFLSICREVWEQWRRRENSSSNPESSVPDWKTQAVAIDTVSKSWHRNFSHQPGRPAGDVRMRFIDELASWLRSKMLADIAMSYPGGNGFSLTQSELESSPELNRLLEEAVGWGDLYEVDHTSKSSREKHTNPRKKFYINPILSPHYQIPEAHTKEPLYENSKSISSLAKSADALLGNQPDLPFPE